jgi:hypothetical protein
MKESLEKISVKDSLYISGIFSLVEALEILGETFFVLNAF